MAERSDGPRERMIRSAALLVREQGARATSIDDVLAHSGAPRGSVYHHFPGGREELLREATAFAGAMVARRMLREDGPLPAFDALCTDYRSQLLATDYRAGCPVVAVAVEAGEDGPVRDEAGAVFGRWSSLLARGLRDRGAEPGHAARLADLVIAGLEGGIVLSRARRDITPFDHVSAELRALLERETGADRPPPEESP